MHAYTQMYTYTHTYTCTNTSVTHKHNIKLFILFSKSWVYRVVLLHPASQYTISERVYKAT